MKNVLIAGGSGFIGKYLTRRLTEEGYKVSILSRSARNNGATLYYYWNPDKGIIDKESLKNQQVIINLAGASIADKLWTKKKKETIVKSRIQSTRLLINSLEKNEIRPELFINASAIGYYGHRPGEILTEQSARGTGFLSQVCYNWEQALKPLSGLKIPYAIIRLGIVLGKERGSLQKMMLPLKFRFNVIFGKGEQIISWIHIEDVFRIIYHLIEGKLSSGIYNGVAPNILNQSQFNGTLLNLLHLKALTVRIPDRLLKFLIGEMATVFTNYQQIKPQKLLDQRFQFKYPEINNALNDLFSYKNHVNK